MSGKSFFIDVTRCTACRGCQVACKQWHKLPAEKTVNRGSYQNPEDTSFTTYKLVRFTEVEQDGKLNWLFFPDQCRHCVEPPCKAVAEHEGSILQDPLTGAVLFTDLTAKESIDNIRGACPYDIPRQDASGKIMAKCDMCIDRVHNGMLPACVQACPTGTMNFGDREDMLGLAKQRLSKVKGEFPKARLIDSESVRTIYLCGLEPSLYHTCVTAEATLPRGFDRRGLLASVLRPFAASTSG